MAWVTLYLPPGAETPVLSDVSGNLLQVTDAADAGQVAFDDGPPVPVLALPADAAEHLRTTARTTEPLRRNLPLITARTLVLHELAAPPSLRRWLDGHGAVVIRRSADTDRVVVEGVGEGRTLWRLTLEGGVGAVVERDPWAWHEPSAPGAPDIHLGDQAVGWSGDTLPVPDRPDVTARPGAAPVIRSLAD